MSVTINTKYGKIDVSNEVIATIVGGAATDIFGVVGMASKNQIRDGVNEILRRENYSKGVVVKQDHGKINVDVNIVVGYGVKISEVARNVKDKVKYNLETMLGMKAEEVNVIVQSVKVIEEVK
ncbi:Asp23/Gls24 family envelope stress response protein [Lactobacillus sp. YT155]|uniref:Asp23/Gls24 family envelope stress response protein n=1 Tax=Lactobacillus sp. YT155 TaxID=3060955 RepID=UPI00265E5BA3|nr:Asp23/Gls24 family envelope stress response protein [Lactobacillus sp. YT155]MDO1605540.1 Asp23/Gls24 family envelope stress response protein [Lactobacillus sp. YT155]